MVFEFCCANYMHAGTGLLDCATDAYQFSIPVIYIYVQMAFLVMLYFHLILVTQYTLFVLFFFPFLFWYVVGCSLSNNYNAENNCLICTKNIYPTPYTIDVTIESLSAGDVKYVIFFCANPVGSFVKQ